MPTINVNAESLNSMTEKANPFFMHETRFAIGDYVMLEHGQDKGRIASITICPNQLNCYHVRWQDASHSDVYENELIPFDESRVYCTNED